MEYIYFLWSTLVLNFWFRATLVYGKVPIFATQRVILGLVTALGNLIEVRNLRYHPGRTKSESVLQQNAQGIHIHIKVWQGQVYTVANSYLVFLYTVERYCKVRKWHIYTLENDFQEKRGREQEQKVRGTESGEKSNCQVCLVFSYSNQWKIDKCCLPLL